MRTAQIVLLLLASIGLAACDAFGDWSEDEPVGVPQEVDDALFTTTASGLKYYDFVEGTGASPEPGDTVAVHYAGWVQSTGARFDSSYDRGRPFVYIHDVDPLIEGWEEGIATMKVGGERQLVIPPELGYGAQGNSRIPPNSTLIFEIVLLTVRK